MSHVINQESHVYSWNLAKIYLVHFLKFWNIPRLTREISKFQKSKLGKFIPNFPLKHVSTSTNTFLLSHHKSLQLIRLFSYLVRDYIITRFSHKLCFDSLNCLTEILTIIPRIIWQNKNKTLLKRGLWNRCFPVNFGKFLRIPFL